MTLERTLHMCMIDYVRFTWTAAMHTLSGLPRRRVSILAGAALALPVALPIALAIPDDMWLDPDGEAVFMRVGEMAYMAVLCPLLALFFSCSLIGEDIEAQTFAYILTRPIPRSAWVAGKFLGYWLGASALLAAALGGAYLASTALSNFAIDSHTLGLWARFAGVGSLSLGAYGALGLMLGALVKRPMIWGLLLIFGWQRFALLLPGYADAMTIDKYVLALLPESQRLPSLRESIAEVTGLAKLYVPVSPWEAFFTLLAIIAGFVALTALTVYRREYTAAQSAAG